LLAEATRQIAARIDQSLLWLCSAAVLACCCFLFLVGRELREAFAPASPDEKERKRSI